MVYKNIGYIRVEQAEEEQAEREEQAELEEEVLGDIEDYNELTVADLQDKAEQLGLENYKGLKKAELINLIKGE